jgi:hypothetical protein
MSQSKNYIVDTNVLLDDSGALFKLRNGNENRIFIDPDQHPPQLNPMRFELLPRPGDQIGAVAALKPPPGCDTNHRKG